MQGSTCRNLAVALAILVASGHTVMAAAFDVVIKADQLNFKTGSRVTIHISMKNRGASVARIEQCVFGVVWTDLKVSVRRTSGAEVPSINPGLYALGPGKCGPQSFAAGQERIVYDIEAAQQFDMRATGSYRIQVEWKGIKSNLLTVSVTN